MRRLLCLALATAMALFSSHAAFAAKTAIPKGVISAAGSGLDLEGNMRSFNVSRSANSYYMYDAKRNIRIYDAAGIDETKTPITDYNLYPPLTSSSPDKWPKQAVTIMTAAVMVYDYYDHVLGHKGRPGGRLKTLARSLRIW